MKVLVVNGPNLNLLGVREPEVYGRATLADLDESVVRWGESMGIEVETLQSNHEGVLIDAIQRTDVDGIVLNPAAYTHTSRAIGDAIAAVPTPVVEVHISNIKEREPWRAESVVAAYCVRSIYGRGLTGYRDALRHLVNRAAMPFETASYGTDPEQVGDLRRGERGLVVLVHGGFWRHEWERDSMETLAVDLSRRGINTWNIEYRRLGTGGGWPESFEDVVSAIDFGPQLGFGDAPTVVIGHSAGGYMSMWAATQSTRRPRLVISMAAASDLQTHANSGLYGADEVRILIDSGAPTSAHPGSVNTVLVHGTGDRHVPHQHSLGLAERSGLDLISVDTGHFQLLDPARAPWPDVAILIEEAVD